jgi:hypothetical protein
MRTKYQPDHPDLLWCRSTGFRDECDDGELPKHLDIQVDAVHGGLGRLVSRVVTGCFYPPDICPIGPNVLVFHKPFDPNELLRHVDACR